MHVQVDIISEGDIYYARALRSIRAARHHVEFMVYIWQDDEIGRLFERALVRAARKGIEVELVIDAVGSFDLPAAVVSRLEASGIRVYMHHRLKVLRFSWFRYLIRRNHRKILIVDRDEAYTGGFNVMRECSQKYVGESRWLDLMTRTRNAAIVKSIAQQYHDACRRARHTRWAARLLARSGNKVIVASGRHIVTYAMSRWLKRRLRRAQSHIILAVPYFVPYGFFWRILVKKLKQNVRVEIILSEHSDLKWIDDVSFRMAHRLIEKGAVVHLYRDTTTRPRFSHAKFFRIDDWVGTGSANYDYRSMVLNLDTLIFFRPASAELAAYADRVRSVSRPGSRETLHFGFRSWLLWPFRWLL